MDLLLGDRGRGDAVRAEGAQQHLGGPRQQPHERPRELGEDRHRARDIARDVLRIDLAQPLRHQLADDDRHVGDDDDDERGRRPVGIRLARAERLEPVGEGVGERRLADDPVQDADRRDADLDRRQEAVRIGAQREGDRRAAVAFLGELLEPGLARGDQRDLGHREQTVQHDQCEQEGDFHQVSRTARSGSRSGGRVPKRRHRGSDSLIQSGGAAEAGTRPAQAGRRIDYSCGPVVTNTEVDGYDHGASTVAPSRDAARLVRARSNDIEHRRPDS